MYKNIIRPALFTIAPEKIHDITVRGLKYYRNIPLIRNYVKKNYQPKESEINILGLKLINRIGLSAGFDKKGESFDELSDFGFGFIEIGTVTPHAQDGNPKPRVFRLPKDSSIISRTGFNNPGLKAIEKNIDLHRNKNSKYLIGLNINKDPKSEGDDIIADFLLMFSSLYERADYFTVNWGSILPEDMDKVLETLNNHRINMEIRKPVFVKIPADATPEIIEVILAMIAKNDIDGIIATGPTMKRNNLVHYSEATLEKIGAGGVSGKGIGDRSYDIVRHINTHQNRPKVIIGAGGIMTPSDAHLMMCAGADLIQIYSAFIFSGPSIVKRMAKEVDSL